MKLAVSVLWYFATMAVAAPSKRDIIEKQSEAMRLHIERQSISKRQMMPSNSTAGTIPMNVTFANPKASAFFVDGTTIPEVDFDAGPSCKYQLIAFVLPFNILCRGRTYAHQRGYKRNPTAVSRNFKTVGILLMSFSFFWYFPPNSTDPRASDDLVFWTNGGVPRPDFRLQYKIC